MSTLDMYRLIMCLRHGIYASRDSGVGCLVMRYWKVTAPMRKKPKKMSCRNRPPTMMFVPRELLTECELPRIPPPVGKIWIYISLEMYKQKFKRNVLS